MAAEKTITGYRDKLSARPGDTINFMISSFDGGAYQADLVRIISANNENKFSGLELEPIEAPFSGPHQGRKQVTECGSYARVETDQNPINLSSFSVVCAIKPTIDGRGDATLIALIDAASGAGIELQIDNKRHLSLQVADPSSSTIKQYELNPPLPIKDWSIVGASYDGESRTFQLFQKTAVSRTNLSERTHSLFKIEQGVDLPSLVCNRVMIAASPHTRPSTKRHFTGRIDSVRLLSRAATPQELEQIVITTRPLGIRGLEGFWDFSTDMEGAGFEDLSAHKRHGLLKNLPTRAVRGFRWTGEEHRWRHRRHHYSAIHFCEFDIYDCEWEVDFSYTIPSSLKSGIYAVRLTKGDEIDYIVFFVAPEIGKPTAKIAFLASTATYLAYANDTNIILMAPIVGGDDAVRPEETMLTQHPEFGLSMYHNQVDGFGIHFSSYLRPTVNIRPDSRAWGLTADGDITHWLEKHGYDYDVITDEQLHKDGGTLLEDYDVVITGTHPEYFSQAMRDGIETFTKTGGRLMYMGGNGFYWKIAYSEAWPSAIELRRAEDGTRAWLSQPGEYYHQFDGDLGGLWQRQELAPNKLVGVGFASQGSPGAMRFRKTQDAENPRVAFAFEGIQEEIIADYGKMKVPAMAEETDRADFSLGTPPHALILASTENAHPGLLRVKEEMYILMPQIVDQEVKADVTFFEVDGGGAVFSTGSIAWSSVLAFRNFDNSVARLTTNVLNRFLDPTPFIVPDVDLPTEELVPEIFRMPPGMAVNKMSYGRIISESFKKALMIFALPLLLKSKKISMPPPSPHRDDTVL